MSQCSLLVNFWPFSFDTTIYLINRLPSPTLSHKSPFELLFHEQPNYSSLKTFGCACYPLLKPYTAHKLQPKTTQCVFLGYPKDLKGYLCYNMSNKRLYTTHHVLFDETIFSFSSISQPTTSMSSQHFSSSYHLPYTLFLTQPNVSQPESTTTQIAYY